MKNWRELALENEDQIKEKMREAFKASIGNITDSWQYSVQLYEEGEVDIHFLSQNSTTTGVFDGEAIEVCHFTRFSLDDMDVDWSLKNWLSDEEKEAFEAWQEETGLEDIEEWDEEIYNRIEKERRQDFISEYMNDNIESKWDDFFAELNNN